MENKWSRYRYKERPKCRKIVDRYIKEGYRLEDIASTYLEETAFDIIVSESIKKQARKMLNEGYRV